MENQYCASYKINHGKISNKSVYSSTSFENILFEASDDTCYLEAMYQGRLLSEKYMSDPKTGKTEVILFGLSSDNYIFPLNNRQNIVECSRLEHVTKKNMSRKKFIEQLI